MALWKSKFGRSFDLSGLTPAQAKQVQDLANRARGGEASALIKSFQKSSNGGKVSTPESGGKLDVATGNKIIEGSTAVGSSIDEKVQALLKDIVPQLQGVSGQAAQDATYANLTKYMDRDQGREEEAMKQELANRGIEYNPGDPTALWGKSLGAIGEKYSGLKAEALNTAKATGSADEAAKISNILTPITSLLGASPNGVNLQSILTKLGLDNDYEINKEGNVIKKQAVDKSGSGGRPRGGGSGDGMGVTIGGDAYAD